MNKIILIGRLTKDPELRTLSSGESKVCRLSLAVDGIPRNGEKTTDFFGNVEVWNKQAESCAKYLTKGRLVAIEGSLVNNNYEKDGKKVYQDKILVNRVQFLESKSSSNSSGGISDSNFDDVSPSDFKGDEEANPFAISDKEDEEINLDIKPDAIPF